MNVHRWRSPYNFLVYVEQFDMQGDYFFIVAVHLFKRAFSLTWCARLLRSNTVLRLGNNKK